MKLPLSLSLLCLLEIGCARHSTATETPPPPSQAATTPAAVPVPNRTVQVALPYSFSRRGVEVKVYSIEFVEGQLHVNLQLQETQARPIDLLAATFLQARTPAGEVLAFKGFSRAGQVETGTAVRIAANEKVSVVLFFQAPPAAEGQSSPVELQFPTGKWWSSAGFSR